MKTLGERIRKLRLEKKLTLATVAGDKLTKGMLSLIENNKANPSMESLTYIAKQLAVTVNELLQEVGTAELQKLLGQVETLYHTNNIDCTKEFQQAVALIEPYVMHLTQGYEAARLLEIYGKCLHFIERNGWEEYLHRAARIFDQLKITNHLASIGTFKALTLFKEMKYTESLKRFLQERAAIESNYHYIDVITRMDLDYTEAILQFAVGEYDTAFNKVDKAMEFARKEHIFVNIHHLYSLAIIHSFIRNDDEQFNFYMNKLHHYYGLTEEETVASSITLLNVHRMNSFLHQHEKALQLIEKYEKNRSEQDYHQHFAILEKGKALYYLGQYEDALQLLEQVEIPYYIKHPFDLSIFYEGDAYIARCHIQLGNQIEAIRFITVAMKNVERMPPTPYKESIRDTYHSIVSSK